VPPGTAVLFLGNPPLPGNRSTGKPPRECPVHGPESRREALAHPGEQGGREHAAEAFGPRQPGAFARKGILEEEVHGH
jgi:hypothetical protein